MEAEVVSGGHTDPVTQTLEGMHHLQEELQVVRQGQRRDSSTYRVTRPGKEKPYTFRKKASECQLWFIDSAMDSKASTTTRLDKVVVMDANRAEQLDLMKWDITEGMALLSCGQK